MLNSRFDWFFFLTFKEKMQGGTARTGLTLDLFNSEMGVGQITAESCKKPASRFRNLIAAIYPARAIVELMLEALDKKELTSFQNKDAGKNRGEFENLIAPKLPQYYLIEKIRIHDFHRFGCLPPQPGERVLFYGGPIKLTRAKEPPYCKELAKARKSQPLVPLG